MSNLDSMSVRVELRDSSKIAAVGDYFRRLGAQATIRNGSAVEIEFPEGSLSDDESIDEYLRSWSTKNGVDVTATAVVAAAAANVSLRVLSATAAPLNV